MKDTFEEFTTHDNRDACPFLFDTDIPPNLKGLKPGDKVKCLRYRPVRRVGYRYTAADFKIDASQLTDTDEVEAARSQLNKAAGCRLSRHDIQNAIAYALCAKNDCGGPWRGIHVGGDGEPLMLGDSFEVLTVESTRRVMTGKRYAPSRPSNYYGDDADPGGLEPRKLVILVSFEKYGFELMSGDLVRA